MADDSNTKGKPDQIARKARLPSVDPSGLASDAIRAAVRAKAQR